MQSKLTMDNNQKKRFLTYDEQIELLNKKGISCNTEREYDYLARIGYFNLINGYKEPFVTGRNKNGEHIYLKDVSVDNIYDLYSFDQQLSGYLFPLLKSIEHEVRALTIYQFDKSNNNGLTHWSDVNSYDDTKDKKIIQKTINQVCINVGRSKNDYITHYRNKDEQLPTWIAFKVVNFSTLISIIANSKSSVYKTLCSRYRIQSRKILLSFLHCIRIFRNASAHNERFFSTRLNHRIYKNEQIIQLFISNFGKSPNQKYRDFFDLLIALKYFLSKDEFDRLASFLHRKLNVLNHLLPKPAYHYVLNKMGIRENRIIDGMFLDNDLDILHYLNIK
ncbi:MAG: Abi family protein [Eubacteriales bacterium]|nr:Abi family protein [Eubacteriales bacterium]